MTVREFLADKGIYLVLETLCYIFLAFFMSESGMEWEYILLILLTIGLITSVQLGHEFYKKKRFYTRLFSTLDTMEKKQYIGQVVDTAEFLDGRYLTEVIQEVTKAMNDEIACYQMRQKEYQEYIETWIHEVKLPIASISLYCDNSFDPEAMRIKHQLSRIDNYVEQALYYAKSTNVEQDYRVQRIQLSKVVKEYLKGHAAELIEQRTKIVLEDLDHEVYTDSKWLIFMLNQICSNSVKYRRDTLELKFYAKEHENTVVLYIEDNAMGIEKSELTSVFQKGYTGRNGRERGKSTGIGLYLCKKLCDKMNHGITISSVKGEGTTVKITFPKNYFHLVEKEM